MRNTQPDRGGASIAPFPLGEALETTLHRYVLLYNQQLPQSALGSKTPLQTMNDWHTLKPELFWK